MERALLVLSALLLNALLAGPHHWYEALGLAGLSAFPAQALRDIERRLNRDHRSAKERRTRGTLLAFMVLAVSLVTGTLCGWWFRKYLPFGGLLLLILMLPVRPAWDTASSIRKYLKAGDLPAARQVLENTPWRHHALMDDDGVARAAIETLAVQFSENILAPALWYMALGLPGLFLSKTVWLLAETLVRPGNADHDFSRTAQKAHMIIHYLPSRLSALLWLTASLFVLPVHLRNTVRAIASAMAKEPPQILSLIAAASVLDASLGGPGSAYAHERWIGSGTTHPTPAIIGRALYLFAILHLLLFLLIGLAL